MRAMILAAGRGERMRPLTDMTPKPLLPVNGVPLIIHTLRALVAAGIPEVVINHAWLGEQLEAALGDGRRFGASIRYCAEPPGALETGGGILAALPLLGVEPFLVVSGDLWTAYPYANIAPLSDAFDARLVTVPNPRYRAGGDFWLMPDGRLRREPGRDGERVTYASLALLSSTLFEGARAGRFPLSDLLFAAASRGRLGGERFDGAWVNVGTPADLDEATLAAQRAGTT